VSFFLSILYTGFFERFLFPPLVTVSIIWAFYIGLRFVYTNLGSTLLTG